VSLADLKGTGGANTPFCVTDTATSELFSTEKAAPSTDAGDHTTITNAQFSTSRASLTWKRKEEEGGRGGERGEERWESNRGRDGIEERGGSI
jgi:hypothetical protein